MNTTLMSPLAQGGTRSQAVLNRALQPAQVSGHEDVGLPKRSEPTLRNDAQRGFNKGSIKLPQGSQTAFQSQPCHWFTISYSRWRPFHDNGRLSRIFTTLVLLQNGYAYVPYSSLESVIEQSKESYLLALRQTQRTIPHDLANAALPIWQDELRVS